MPSIRILSEEVRNLIAAGEVVERPASVVKELVENAIDAGATEIRVEVAKGGLEEIMVTDDGCGMDADDLSICVASHATSKLASADDLADIKTMGFRGEALPSIASVSKMAIESRPAASEALSGHLLTVEGGVIKGFEEKGTSVGTRVTVSDLFYNMPARKKFARAPRTELGHIKDITQRLALANPEIRFQLISDGKEIINAFSIDDRRQRAGEVLGSGVVRDCYLCAADAGEIRVHGLVGDPKLSQEGVGGLYWFVNRRPVKDKMLNHAIGEAYRSLLPRGSGPFSMLFIDLPADLVDVNVHPTKNEVRFLNGGAIHDFVVSAVRKTLQTCSMLPVVAALRGGHDRGVDVEAALRAGHKQVINASQGGHRGPPLHCDTTSLRAHAAKQSPEYLSSFEKRDTRYEMRDTSPRPIGQLHNSYLLCEGPDGGLVIIDQHAAHERIGYEKLKQAYQNSVVQSQMLLVPEMVSVPSKTVGYLEDALGELNKIGWEVEYFGGDNFCVKAVPAIVGNVNLKTVMVAIASELSEHGKMDSLEDRIDLLMKVSACHAQVRAGDRLEMSEIRHLLSEMGEFNWLDRCPHGRPAVFEISLDEIGKWFGR